MPTVLNHSFARLIASKRNTFFIGNRRHQLIRPCPLAKPSNCRHISLNPIKASMDQSTENTIEKIHSTSAKIVIFVTGGASQASGWLLSIPGASRSILEIRIPYCTESQTEILGHRPRSSVCVDTAINFAKAAYKQAAQLAPIGTPIVGIGATCALATDRDRRGEHKAFISAHSGTATRTYSLHLSKGNRTRLQEDTIASRLLIKAVADSMGVGTSYTDIGIATSSSDSQQQQQGEEKDTLEVVRSEVNTTSLIRDMLNGRIKTLEFAAGGSIVIDAPRNNRIYLPGSFNPLHDGHRELLAAACRMKPDMEGCYELSIGNADKGWLPVEEIERRVKQFTSAQLPVVLTQAPLFTMKAELFHDSVFIVGYDTAVRLVQSQYYGNETAMLLQFANLRHLGCSFLVAGRKDASGKFLLLEDMAVPEVLQRGGLFEGIPESEFRMDISSTELRGQGVTA